MSDENYFKENYIMNGIIKCESGLHIGGSNDIVDIGGIDNEVIRDSATNLPYIPGSSLKGKLRNLLELHDKEHMQILLQNTGKVVVNENLTSAKIFGVPGDTKNVIKGPSRIIVRDSFPNEKTKKLWEKEKDIFNGAELKYENSIDSLDAKAVPRNIERVPKGSEFNFEIIFSIYQDDDENNIHTLFNTMSYLEDDYLGGSGSRGFGKIKFKNISLKRRDLEYYNSEKDEEIIIEDAKYLIEFKNEAKEKL